MPITAPQLPDIPENPYLPPGPNPLVMEVFGGINTSTTRPGVDDKQCYWINGFMPLAPRNLRALPGIGAQIFTDNSGTTIVFFKFFNIGSVPYCAIFLSDGSVWAQNLNTLIDVEILPPGTIINPSILAADITQWAQQYLIIVANQANGYWIWDGSIVYTSGTLSPIVTITSGGEGYYQSPMVSVVGGFGGGASATAYVGGGVVTAVSILNAGLNYRIGDTPSIVFSGGTISGSGASITLHESGGTLSSFSIVASGSNYANPIATLKGGLGPGGAQGAIALYVASVPGPITNVSIISVGYSYLSAPTVSISDSDSSASATVTIMPFDIEGTTVETAFGRVWVANQNEVSFTAAGSLIDFATSDGGGNFSSGDSFLRVKFTRLINTNGFLYLIADSSMNYISGVQTSGSPPTTTFTNQNADPEVGTPYPAGVLLLGRDILLANSWGVHQSRGATLDKISEALDGVWPTASLAATGSTIQLSTAKATIFSKRVWMVLAPIQDPVTGTTTNHLLMYRDKIWWASTQNVTLNYIASQEINSVLTAYCTDGTAIWPMFSAPSSAFSKVVQSRLWDAPGGIGMSKAVGRFWSLWNYNTTLAPSIVLTLDMVGVSSTGLTIDTPQTYTLAGPSTTGMYLTPPEAVGQQGVLVGMTLKTNEGDVQLITSMIQPDPRLSYRG